LCLLVELLNHPTVTYNRFRVLMTRRFIKSILEDTIGVLAGLAAFLDDLGVVLEDIVD
jgi:hypothetical protein